MLFYCCIVLMFEEFDMVGDFVVHLGFDIDLVETFGADGFEFGLELLVGEGAWVLKLAQTLVGEAVEVSVGNDRFQGSATFICFAVFGSGEPTEEVLRTVIEQVFDEVMADTVIRFAFTVDEGRAFAVEDLAHDDVAIHTVELPYARCVIPSFGLFGTTVRRIRVLQFSPVGIKEIGASLACPEFEPRMSATADEVGWKLIRNRLIHMHRIFMSGDVADSQIRCKGRGKYGD